MNYLLDVEWLHRVKPGSYGESYGDRSINLKGIIYMLDPIGNYGDRSANP